MKRDVKRIAILFVSVAGGLTGCTARDEATSEVRLQLTAGTVGMVVSNTTGAATVFDADSNTIVGSVPGLGGTSLAAGDCSITPDGKKAFFTHFNASVTVADLSGTVPVLAGPPNPIGISNPGEDTALSPDGRFLLVCDGSTPVPVSVIDVATQAQISTFDTGTDCNSIDVCRDGSVLVTSFNSGRVRRLSLSSSGALTDTGDSLSIPEPMNVYCSPAGTAGVVVTFESGTTSFQVPGLAPVSTRTLDLFGVSGAFNHAGDRAYFRTSNGAVTSFAFDQATAALGDTPVFHVAVATAETFFGMDQLAVHPSDASIYVSETGSLRILDAATGATVGSIDDPSIGEGTGVCFTPRAPNKPPVARCADRTVAADGTCHAPASIDDGSFDPDAGDTIQCTQAPSGPFDQGATSVTLTCTDSHGATASCSATVTVVDQTAPALTCPADQTLECNNGHGGAVATFTATATDNCDAAPAIACVPASGSTFALGTTTDTCSASDAAGNASRCSHAVTVADTAPPVVVTKDVPELWPPNHKYHRIELDDCIASIQDTCQGPLDTASHTQITCCTSDEPDNGQGDGDSSHDCVIVDDHSVDVRAEREGGGNGRVYTIHYTVTDGSNTSDHTCTVGVPHSKNGGPAIDDGPRTACP